MRLPAALRARLRDPRFGVRGARRGAEPTYDEESGLRNLLEQLPIVTYRRRIDDEPGTGYVTGEVEALTGYPIERWEEPDFTWAVIHPDDCERVRTESARRRNGRYTLEFRIIRADGSLGWVRDEMTVTRARPGGDTYVHGFLVDITQQKLAEARLQASEERYRRLAEHLPLVTYISPLEAGGRPKYVSPQFENLLGISAAECVENPTAWWDILHPDDRERVMREEMERRTSLEPYVTEYRLVRPDGSVVWVRDESVVFRDDDRDLGYLQGFVLDVTDQHNAEEETRRREALLAEALRIGRMGAFEFDLATEELTWSDEILNAFGISRRDASTKLVDVLERRVHPDDRETITQAYRRAFETGEPFCFEHRLLVDGAVRVARTQGEVQLDGSGRPLRAFGIAQDITAEVEAREELACAEERYRSLVERIPVVTYVDRVDANSTSLYMSPQVVPLLGYSLEEWQDDDFFRRIVHPDDIDRVPKHQNMKVGDKISAEYRVFTKEGRVVWLRDEFVVVQDEGEEIPHMEGFLEDITRRKVAEERLRESEKRFREMLESAAVGFLLLDDERRILFTNRAFQDIVGYSYEELTGRRLAEISHPDDEPASRARVAEFKDGVERSVFEKQYIRKDGEPVWARISWTAVREGAQLQYIIAIVEDLTERKHLEDELRHAQKMEAVGRLAGAVAHDFNNLLLAIRGYSELALADVHVSAEATTRDLEAIKKSSESAASLTAQLLALGRKQMLRPRTLDLNAIVSGRESLLKQLLGEQIALETGLANSVLPVLLDEAQLEHTLVNVIMNARDATSGAGTVSIATENVSVGRNGRRPRPLDPGSYVLLSVTDTGTGMSEATMQHAFDPFFTTKGDEGTGLGLSTVHGFVEQSGGQVFLESTEGEGTTVELYFPAVAEAVVPPEAAQAPAGETAGSETVLLVEDEDVVRAVLRAALEREGYTVLEAANGEDAVRSAEDHDGEIRVMITDVVMPRMGGVEAARRILSARAGTEVVYMSGHLQDPGVLEEVQEHGIFLEKPFAPSDLARKVRELLGTGETVLDRETTGT